MRPSTPALQSKSRTAQAVRRAVAAAMPAARSPEQEAAARAAIQALELSGIYDQPIVTEVAPLDQFFPAEGYHQGYFHRNPYQPYCMGVVAPKVAKIRKQFFERLKR